MPAHVPLNSTMKICWEFDMLDVNQSNSVPVAALSQLQSHLGRATGVRESLPTDETFDPEKLFGLAIDAACQRNALERFPQRGAS